MPLLMIISLIIYVGIMYLAIRDFKRTVIVWIPLSLLFNPQVCIIYSPKAMALTVAINLSLIVLYFLNFVIRNSRDRYRYNMEKFTLAPFMLLMLFSLFISSLFSVIPFMSSFNKLVKSSIMNYGMLYVFFKCINTSDDIRLCVKTYVLVAVLITTDALIENFMHINPAGDFIYMSSPHTEELKGRSFYFPYFISHSFSQRYGLKRCCSFFGLHIAFGVACTCIFFLFMTFAKERWAIFNRQSEKKNRFMLLCLILLGIGVILSNSKTPMLGMCMLLPAFYGLKDIANVRIMLPLTMVCAVVLFYVPEYLNNFVALIDEKVAVEGKGSTMAMREEQFFYIMKLFDESPVFGNGIGASLYFSRNVSGFSHILGAESVWFQLLADQGLLGCIAYIYMYFSLVHFCRGIVPRRIIIPFLLSILLMETATGNLDFLLWTSVLVLVRRRFQLEWIKNYVSYWKPTIVVT